MIQTVSIKDTRDNLAELVERGKMGSDGNFDKVFGIWRDRKDIKNSAAWVRNLRIKTSLRVKDE